MTATTTPVLGRRLWYELLTSDLAAAESFYETVVGWTTTPFEGAGMPYKMWTPPDRAPIGGVLTLPPDVAARGVPPHWIMYVGVDRLEDGAAHVQKLGGAPVSPVIEVPEVGRMQVVKDAQGAAFSIYEPAKPPAEPEAKPELGDVSWIELYTSDASAALSFYDDLFGWKSTETMDMGPMGKYYMFGRTLGSMGGMMTKTPDMAQVPTAWLIYFRVPDVHAAAERVKANGGQIVNGPMEVPGGDWIVQATDPQGAAFALHHTKS